MIAIVAGSGIANAIPDDAVVAHQPIGDFLGTTAPTVAGHGSDVVTVDVDGRTALIALGRQHLYEGASSADVCRFVDVVADLGYTHLLLTNAAGGLHPLARVGDLVLGSDLINATNRKPPTHPEQRITHLLDPDWGERIEARARDLGIRLQRGVYVSVLGPSYETRAEIRMYRKMGADVIGMSTVLEAHHARSRGMSVATLSLVSNVLSDVDTPPIDHAHVVEAGRQGAQALWTAMKSAIFTL